MLDALNTSIELRGKAALPIENIFNGSKALGNFPCRQRRAECNPTRTAGDLIVTPGALPHKPSAAQALGRHGTRALNIAVALIKSRNKLLSRLRIGTCVERVILYLVKCRFKRRDDICKILARDKRR